MCSGSDICVEALSAIAEVCGGILHHRFSCEINPQNQLWIQQQMQKCPDHVFEDVTAFSTGKGYCVIGGKTRMLPPSEIIYVGFSCKDVSRMNIHSASSRHCIRQSSLRTGGAFAGALSYIHKMRPMVAFLENVAAIDDVEAQTGISNADDIREIFAQQGYILCDSICNSFYHGVPHQRTRWWAAAVQVSSEPLTEEEIESYSKQVADFHACLQMLRLNPVSLDDILMQEDSDELKVWQEERMSEKLGRVVQQVELGDGCEGEAEASEPEEEVRGQKQAAWPDLHGEHFRSHSIRHPPVFSLLYSTDEIEKLRCLPMRSREIVYLFDTLHGRAQQEEVIDIGQSIYRIRRMVGGLPCITPGNLLWLRLRFRLVQPNELLQAQGIALRTRSEVASFSQKNLTSLAGNAFSAYTCQAVSISALGSFEFFDRCFEA